MRNIWTIARREYHQFFSTPIAYMIAFVLLLVLAIFFYINLQVVFLQPGYVPGVEMVLAPMATMLVMITPAVTTRLLAEEQRLGTIELLLTAPIRDWELVLGKWLGGFLLLSSMIGLALIFPLMLNQLVDPGIDQGPVLSGFIGLLLISAALVAIGVFVSSLFNNSIAAFVFTLGVFVIIWWILGPIVQVIGPASGNAALINYLDFSGHFFSSLFVGIIDTRDVIYYTSITMIALYLAVASVEMRRWR